MQSQPIIKGKFCWSIITLFVGVLFFSLLASVFGTSLQANAATKEKYTLQGETIKGSGGIFSTSEWSGHTTFNKRSVGSEIYWTSRDDTSIGSCFLQVTVNNTSSPTSVTGLQTSTGCPNNFMYDATTDSDGPGIAYNGALTELDDGAVEEVCRAAGVTGSANIAACVDGANNKSKPVSYCIDKYPSSPDPTGASSPLGKRNGCLAGQGNNAYDECIEKGFTGTGRGTTLEACLDGSKNKGTTDYCNKYLSRVGGAGLAEACTQGTNAKTTATETPESSAIAGGCEADPEAEGCKEQDQTTCAIDGIGWIICPVVNFMANITDGAYGLVSQMLSVTPSMFDRNAPQGQAMYESWSIMRNIANVMFVIAFIVIIYSQLTSFGVSNYGVKKLLPRIIIAAILVNMSFIICALAVDLSNILGGSLKGLIDGIVGNVTKPTDNNFWGGLDGAADAPALANGAGAILAMAGAGILIYINFAALLPVLIAALAAIVVVVLVLTLRQALIILLVVISPLAFVAFLLPNTENWFKKWRGLLFTLLLMYPVIALIFGASALAGKIIMLVAEGNVLLQIMGAGVTIIPLVITPVIMKTAGGLLNRFAGIVNNTDKGVFDRMRKRADQYGKDVDTRRQAQAMKGGNKKGALGYMSRFTPAAARRRRAERGAVSRQLESSTRYAEADYIANATTGDTNSSELIGVGRNSLANRLAGGGIMTGNINPIKGADEAAVDSVKNNALAIKAKLEAEDLREAMTPLINKIAQWRASGGNVDQNLKDIATNAGGGHSAVEQKAAMHQLAALGRDSAIRDLRDNSSLSESQQQSLQQAITANAGALAGKAPDLVKNDNKAAFGAIKADEISKLSAGGMKSYMDYLRTDATQDMKQNFVNALHEIKNDPSIRGSMNIDQVTEIIKGSSGSADLTAAVQGAIDTSSKRFR